jgi:hypothetical protein
MVPAGAAFAMRLILIARDDRQRGSMRFELFSPCFSGERCSLRARQADGAGALRLRAIADAAGRNASTIKANSSAETAPGFFNQC